MDHGFSRGYVNRLRSQREGDCFYMYLFHHLITTSPCEVGTVMTPLRQMRKQGFESEASPRVLGSEACLCDSKFSLPDKLPLRIKH